VTALGYLIVILMCFGPGSGFGANAAWREVRTPDGRCAVLMPGPPTRKKLGQQFRAGAVSIDAYEVVRQNTTFSLHHFELPPGEDPDAFTRDYGQGIARPLGATLRPEQQVWQGGHNGKEYVLVLPNNGGTLVRRLFLVGRHVYLLSVSGTNVSSTSPDVTRFFNSLSLR
jgi:hypothetical protein